MASELALPWPCPPRQALGGRGGGVSAPPTRAKAPKRKKKNIFGPYVVTRSARPGCPTPSRASSSSSLLSPPPPTGRALAPPPTHPPTTSKSRARHDKPQRAHFPPQAPKARACGWGLRRHATEIYTRVFLCKSPPHLDGVDPPMAHHHHPHRSRTPLSLFLPPYPTGATGTGTLPACVETKASYPTSSILLDPVPPLITHPTPPSPPELNGAQDPKPPRRGGQGARGRRRPFPWRRECHEQ